MKASSSWFITLLLVLAASPAWAQNWSYDNGPINGATDAWTINYGYVTADTFLAGGTGVNSFSFGVWEFPGDTMTSVQWSITSVQLGVPPNALGNSIAYGSGTASGANLTDTFISTNQYGYDIDKITVSGLNVATTSGITYWLNLQNASVPSQDPVFWDENSGAGCQGAGCPSRAWWNAVGTIASEAFTVSGCTGCGCLADRSGCTTGPGETPEPNSILLLSSGILGLVGVLRRKLF
jgi:hypothetical protein